jgi:hypothetical protein
MRAVRITMAGGVVALALTLFVLAHPEAVEALASGTFLFLLVGLTPAQAECWLSAGECDTDERVCRVNGAVIGRSD